MYFHVYISEVSLLAPCRTGSLAYLGQGADAASGHRVQAHHQKKLGSDSRIRATGTGSELRGLGLCRVYGLRFRVWGIAFGMVRCLLPTCEAWAPI